MVLAGSGFRRISMRREGLLSAKTPSTTQNETLPAFRCLRRGVFVACFRTGHRTTDDRNRPEAGSRRGRTPIGLLLLVEATGYVTKDFLE